MTSAYRNTVKSIKCSLLRKGLTGWIYLRQAEDESCLKTIKMCLDSDWIDGGYATCLLAQVSQCNSGVGSFPITAETSDTGRHEILQNVNHRSQSGVQQAEPGLSASRTLATGPHRWTAENDGFRKIAQDGIRYRWDSCPVSISPSVRGNVSETITITADAVLIKERRTDSARCSIEHFVKEKCPEGRDPRALCCYDGSATCLHWAGNAACLLGMSLPNAPGRVRSGKHKEAYYMLMGRRTWTHTCAACTVSKRRAQEFASSQ